jgi:hypothetical protein
VPLLPRLARTVLLVGLGALLLAGCGSSGNHRHAAGSATTAPSTTTPTTTSQRPASAFCRSDPHQGVHDPQRLKVHKPCATFDGTVVEAPERAPDGDLTFFAAPDRAHKWMLNAKNRRKGGLHIAIVPRDQPSCKRGQRITGYPVNNLGACSGAHVQAPPLGAHVRVIGPYVLDSWDHWNEIHPAWTVEILAPKVGSG